jgi:hypothetical protein
MPQASSAPDFIPAETPDFIPAETPPPLPPAPQPRPGFVSRAAEALGIPMSEQGVKQATEGMQLFGPNHPVLNAIAGPAGTAAKTAIGYGQNLLSGLTEPLSAEDQARYAAHPMEKIPDVASKYLLEHVLSPVGGAAVSNLATDIGDKNIGAAGGDLAGTIANLLMMKSAKGPKTEGKLAYSTGAEAKDIMKAAPDLINEAAKSGKPADLNGLIDGTIKNAKGNLNTEYSTAKGPYGSRSITPSQVSQKLLSLITPNMDMTEIGKATKKQIMSAAKEFQKGWTIDQLDQERMDANARAHAFEKKGDVDQYAASRGVNRSALIDKTIAQGIRDTIYPMLDQFAGKPKGYFANLKDRVGALMNLESDAKDHRDALRTHALKSEGAPMMERLKLRGLVGEEGHPRFYFSNILSPSDRLATAGNVASGAFPGAGTSAARAAALVEALRKAAPNHPLVQQEQ